MSDEQDAPPARRSRSMLVAIGIVMLVTAVIVLHLTGVVGPG